MYSVRDPDLAVYKIVAHLMIPDMVSNPLQTTTITRPTVEGCTANGCEMVGNVESVGMLGTYLRSAFHAVT